MQGLMVLRNPRYRYPRHRYYNPENPENPELNPRHHKRHRNPSGAIAAVQERFLGGVSVVDVLVGVGSLIATEKIGAAIKDRIVPPSPPTTLVPVPEAAKPAVEPVVDLLVTGVLTFAASQFANKSTAAAVATGGLYTTVCNTIKQIKPLQTLVAPGSLVIGGRPQLPAVYTWPLLTAAKSAPISSAKAAAIRSW